MVNGANSSSISGQNVTDSAGAPATVNNGSNFILSTTGKNQSSYVGTISGNSAGTILPYLSFASKPGFNSTDVIGYPSSTNGGGVTKDSNIVSAITSTLFTKPLTHSVSFTENSQISPLAQSVHKTVYSTSALKRVSLTDITNGRLLDGHENRSAVVTTDSSPEKGGTGKRSSFRNASPMFSWTSWYFRGSKGFPDSSSLSSSEYPGHTRYGCGPGIFHRPCHSSSDGSWELHWPHPTKFTKKPSSYTSPQHSAVTVPTVTKIRKLNFA